MARQQIQTFYQRVRGGLPVFETEVRLGETECTLRMPAVKTREGCFSEQVFKAVARNKKLAIAQASDKGLEFLKLQPLFASSQPPDDLWDVIAKLMAPQSLRKEPEFEGHVLLAQRFSEGWIPIQLLATSRPVSQWAKKHLPAALKSPEAFLQLVQEHLKSHTFPLTAQAHIKKDDACSKIRRKDRYPGRRDGGAVGALHATVDHGAGRSFSCIIIPAEPRLAIEERQIQGGGFYWRSLAEALGTTSDGLLYWDKFGRSKEIYMPDESMAAQLDDPELMRILLQHLGPLPERAEKLSEVSQASTVNSSLQAASKSSLQQDDEEQEIPFDGVSLTQVRQPALYSQARSAAVNQRASWMLGKPVHGDCLVSYCRLRPCEWRTPSVKWASLPLPAFWAWLGATMPSAEYAAGTGMPLLARLPTKFRTAKAWFGSLPVDLLVHHVGVDICLLGPEYHCRPLSDDPDALWECTGSLGLLGDEAVLRSESVDCATEDAARQQAALALLQEYERRYSRLMQSGIGHGDAAHSQENGHAEEVSVSKRGEAEVPPHGTIVKFGFRLKGLENSPFPEQLLAAQSNRFEWGSGGIVPAVETLIAACQPGGSACCHVRLPIGGPNPLAHDEANCLLEVKPNQKVKFVGAAQTQTGKDMFIPAMSTQRHERVEKLLAEIGALTVLDIGCGEGRLIEHLLKQAKEGKLALRKVVGLELDEVAARRGVKRLCTRYPGIFEEPSAPGLEVYQADVACQNASKPEWWGRYVGVDAAVFQEVVEHLDPTPLKWLGACLLGALQPRVLILSTPNFEYNAVLHYLQSQLLPSGLRNSGHRFEWTREQFQTWSDNLATQHGYSASFQALGRAAEEDRAFSDPETAFHGKDLGGSTQVAVFRRTAGSATAGSGSVKASCLFDSSDRLAPSCEESAAKVSRSQPNTGASSELEEPARTTANGEAQESKRQKN